MVTRNEKSTSVLIIGKFLDINAHLEAERKIIAEKINQFSKVKTTITKGMVCEN